MSSALVARFFSAGCALLATACVATSSLEPKEQEVTVRVYSRSLSIQLGDTVTMGIVEHSRSAGTRVSQGVGLSTGRERIPNASIRWTSSDTQIVTISESGLVSARAEGLVTVAARTVNGVDSTLVNVRGVFARSRFRMVVTASEHSCGILPSAQLACWGATSRGELGLGIEMLFSYFATPQLVAEQRDVESVAVGQQHTCILRVDKTVACVGDNRRRQVAGRGDGRHLGFVSVAVGEPVIAIGAGGDQTCALTVSGRLLCWGAQYAGVNQVDDVRYTALSVGPTHACAITLSRQVRCWGSNAFGQLGSGSTMPSSQPVLARGLDSVQTVSAGVSHTCATDDSGVAWCWGNGIAGQIGNGSTSGLALEPSRVLSAASFSAISAGGEFTCALATDSRAWCWGSDVRGSLGRGRLPTGQELLQDFLSPVPAAVLSTSRFRTISAGTEGAVCAVTTEAGAECWGNNRLGLLGLGSMRWASALLGHASTPIPSPVAQFNQHFNR